MNIELIHKIISIIFFILIGSFVITLISIMQKPNINKEINIECHRFCKKTVGQMKNLTYNETSAKCECEIKNE